MRKNKDSSNNDTEATQRRFLQDAGDCQCPTGAEFRARSEYEMITALNETLFDYDLLGVMVDDVVEVESVECSPDEGTFSTDVTVTVSAAGTESDAAMQAGNQLRASYNDLANRYCDPFFRSIAAVELEGARRVLAETSSSGSESGSPTGSRRLFNLVFRFRITGLCRGCPNNLRLFNEAVRRDRRLVEEPTEAKRSLQSDEETSEPIGLDSRTQNNRRRRKRFLQSGPNNCYCAAVDVEEGAPTEREFLTQYANDVQIAAGTGQLSALQSIDAIEGADDGTLIMNEADDCTVDADCIIKELGQLCVANLCLRRGNPRITLTWTGDDDLDLSVVTPLAAKIDFEEQYEPITGGVFNTNFDQATSRDHVESIFFPTGSDDVISGTYSIQVTSFLQRGTIDEWTVQVFDGNDILQETYTGTGDSDPLVYRFSEQVAPPEQCVVGDNSGTECCDTADCEGSDSGTICAGNVCVQEGKPRFTLTYYGGE